MAEPASNAPTVLVVEDSFSTSQILALTLRTAGYRPVCVSSVQEALAHLRKVVPDLVITDVDLPDDNGFTICRELRTNPAYAHVKIVVISGTPEGGQIPEKFSGAFDEFFQKPFSLRVFVEKVRAMQSGDGRR